MNRISPSLKLSVLLLILAAMIFVSFCLGRFPLAASDILAAFGGWLGLASETHHATSVVMELRLPRIIGAVAVGAALSKTEGTDTSVSVGTPVIGVGPELVRSAITSGFIPDILGSFAKKSGIGGAGGTPNWS